MNPALLNPELATFSRILVLVALTIYVIAFLVLATSLSNRARATQKDQTAAALRIENIGLILAGLATVVHFAGVLTRGIAANRVPWANMYEFSISGAFVVSAIYLLALFFKDIRFIATFVTGFVVLVIGSANTLFYVQVESLMPALQDYWLVIHVSVAILGTAFFTIAAAVAALLIAKSGKSKSKLLQVFPDVEKLEKLSYQFNVIGFILWTFTLIAGAIWADKAWHRFWGWDTKEVWTFIIWTIYAAYLHATTTRGWEGKKAAWLTLIGFSAVIFNFTIVNLFFKGLHVYSGL
ncbi:MAG: c-type cytochrome biogenesis protein CcsB [Acidobacteria bacterium]|nr:c-type cytochrome biogenesis protein CcsB [Acidobacteriota bacterium]